MHALATPEDLYELEQLAATMRQLILNALRQQITNVASIISCYQQL